VRTLLRQAEDILNTAIHAREGGDVVIILDRRGGMRVMEAAGWSLPALSAEFGASAAFKIRKHQGIASVEGWNGMERCLLQQETPTTAYGQLPLVPAVCHPMRFQVTPLSIAESNQ
jgi:hypothetical protein